MFDIVVGETLHSLAISFSVTICVPPLPERHQPHVFICQDVSLIFLRFLTLLYYPYYIIKKWRANNNIDFIILEKSGKMHYTFRENM